MAAPTISDSDSHLNIASPSSGNHVHTLTGLTIGANTKAVVVRVNGSNSDADLDAVPTVGGLAMTAIHDTQQGSTRRAWTFIRTDLSGRVGANVVVSLHGGPGWYNIWTDAIDHGGRVGVLDDGAATGTGGASVTVPLDTGTIPGLVLAHAVGSVEMTTTGSLTSDWDEAFFGPHHSEGGHRSLTGSASPGWTGGGDKIVHAIALGGIDYETVISSRLSVEAVVRMGFEMTGPALIEPARFGSRVFVREGFAAVADMDWQVRLSSLQGVDTVIETEEGVTGDVLIRQEGSKPIWGSPGAASHPDLAAHDALGLATDSELAAHTGDASDAHDASAISYDGTTSGLTADDVQEAIDEATGDAAVLYDYIRRYWR